VDLKPNTANPPAASADRHEVRGSAYHGSIGGYFAPTAFEGDRLQTDDFQQGSTGERFNLQGKILHQSNYDVDAEIGGYVRISKTRSSSSVLLTRNGMLTRTSLRNSVTHQTWVLLVCRDLRKPFSGM